MATGGTGTEDESLRKKLDERRNNLDNFPGTVSLWAKRVMRYSSQYNNSSWAAICILGTPRVYPRYGDLHGAWAQGDVDAEQFIEIEYEEKLYIREIHIYETYNGGAVTRVAALADNGEWTTLWNTDSPTVLTTSRIFTPNIQETSFQSKAIRLELNCEACNSWCEIDAVCINGVRSKTVPPPPLWALSDDLTLMVNNPLFSDVEFRVDNHVVRGHKVILAARSHYFNVMFCGDFNENQSNTQAVAILDISYKGFLGMMQYLYTNKLDPDITPLNLVELIRVADRFSLDGLSSLSHFYLSEELSVDNVIPIFREAREKLPVLENVRNTCLHYIARHMDKVSQIKDFCELPQRYLLEIIQESAANVKIK